MMEHLYYIVYCQHKMLKLQLSMVICVLYGYVKETKNTV